MELVRCYIHLPLKRLVFFIISINIVDNYDQLDLIMLIISIQLLVIRYFVV